MDLRQYYRKLHELEAKMPAAHALVVSEETGDGGKAGVITEVPRRNACQLMLEGRARLAEPKEAEAYREEESRKRAEFQRAKKASRMQVELVERPAEEPAPASKKK